MNRRLELWLVTGLLLLAALLRLWNLGELPPGFSVDELAYIDITEAVRGGDVAVYYVAPDGTGRAGLYGVLNSLLTGLVGDGLVGYRLLPAFAGLVTLALVYALARRLFGVPVALIALAIAVLNLRLIVLARSGIAAALMPLLVLLVLSVLAAAFNMRREIRFHTPGTLIFALLGVLFGLGAYLHYTALALGPLAVLFVVHLLLTRQPISRRVWGASLFVVVLATIVGIPYLISTLRDVTQSEPYVYYWAERPGSIRDLVDGALHALGGVFWRGDASVTLNVGRASLLGPVLGLLLLVGVAEAIRRWRDPRYALLGLALLFGLLTDTWIGVDTSFAANLVLLPAILILPGVGAQVIADGLRARGARVAWQPVTLALLVVLVGNAIVLRDRVFVDWPRDEAVQEAYHAHMARVAGYLDRTPDGLPVSLCTTRLEEPGPSGMSPLQTLAAMRHREDLAIRHSDCRGGLVLIDAGGPMRFVFGQATDRAQLPPELAEWLSDAEPVAVEGLPEGTVLRMDVQQRLRDAGGQWGALSPVYYMPDEAGGGERAELPVPLDDHLTFAGYDPRALRQPHTAGGNPIVLVTYWRVDGELPDDLGIFAHLLAYPDNDNGQARIPLLEPWAESNAIDVVPRELQKRDFFVQVSYLWLAENLRPANYALTVGAYTDSVSVLANHLNVLDPQREYRPRGDRLVLGNVTVQAPPEAGAADGEAGGDQPAD